MIIKKELFKDLSFEVGETYQTKFATAERFTITVINTNKQGRVIGFKGVYENSKHLGEVPLGADRLIARKEPNGTIEVCSSCGEPNTMSI